MFDLLPNSIPSGVMGESPPQQQINGRSEQSDVPMVVVSGTSIRRDPPPITRASSVGSILWKAFLAGNSHVTGWFRRCWDHLREVLLEGDCVPLKKLINLDHAMGLSPIGISKADELVTSWLRKGTFFLWNGLSVANVVVRAKNILWSLYHATAPDILNHIQMGYEVSRFLLQINYAAAMYRNGRQLTNLVKHFRALAARLGGKTARTLPIILIRMVSIIFSLIGTIGGFHILKPGNNWSLWKVAETYEIDLVMALYPSSVFANYTLADHLFVSPGGGIFWTNPDVDTVIIGGFSLVIDFINQVILTCPMDMLFISAWELRSITTELMHKMQQSQGQLEIGGTNDVNPNIYTEVLEIHEEAWNVAADLNDTLKYFLPSLTLTAVLMTSFVVQVCFQLEWIRALYFAPILVKLWLGVSFAVESASHIQEFNRWFVSKKTQLSLRLDTQEFQRKVEQMVVAPIGIGVGTYYIDSNFMTRFFGIVSTYFFLQAQAMESC